MPDMREEFEAWAERKWPAASTGMVDGEYYLPKLNITWEAWQASRVALAESLELPPVEFARGYEEETLVYHAKSLEEALQQAGIEVAQ